MFADIHGDCNRDIPPNASIHNAVLVPVFYSNFTQKQAETLHRNPGGITNQRCVSCGDLKMRRTNDLQRFHGWLVMVFAGFDDF